MEPIVISDDDGSEVLEVPPFVPSPRPEESIPTSTPTPNLEPAIEISFANLSKESCRSLKEAFVQWAENNARSSPPESELLSGKFRLECSEGEVPRIIYVAPQKEVLTEQEFKSAGMFNEAVDKMFEVPLYKRSNAKLPSTQKVRNSREKPAVQNNQCFNCGSYHHMARGCKRPLRRRLFDGRQGHQLGQSRSGDDSRHPTRRGNAFGAHKRLRVEKGIALPPDGRSAENGISSVQVRSNKKSDR